MMNTIPATTGLAGVDLNLIHVLHHVLQTQSVTLTSERLHVSQPAVSNALARLRALLGDPLLVRRGRRLVRTARGDELVPHVTEVVAGLMRVLVEQQAFDPATCALEFTLSCGDDRQLADAPQMVAALRKRLPHARLKIVSLDYLLSTDGLNSGAVDLVIGPMQSAPPGCRATVVGRDDAVLVMRKDHPLARRGAPPPALEALRFVDTQLVMGRPGAVHTVMGRRLERAGVTLDYAVAVPTFAAAVMVVLEEDLAVGMPEHLARAMARRLPLRVFPHPLGAGLLTTAMIWHERTHHDPARSAFRKLIKEILTRAPKGVRTKG